MAPMSRARFETRSRNKRPAPYAPTGTEKMRASRGKIPMRPKTNVPAKARTPYPGIPGVPVPTPLGDHDAKKCRQVDHHESSGARRPTRGRCVATRLRDPMSHSTATKVTTTACEAERRHEPRRTGTHLKQRARGNLVELFVLGERGGEANASLFGVIERFIVFGGKMPRARS